MYTLQQTFIKKQKISRHKECNHVVRSVIHECFERKDAATNRMRRCVHEIAHRFVRRRIQEISVSRYRTHRYHNYNTNRGDGPQEQEQY